MVVVRTDWSFPADKVAPAGVVNSFYDRIADSASMWNYIVRTLNGTSLHIGYLANPPTWDTIVTYGEAANSNTGSVSMTRAMPAPACIVPQRAK